MFKITKMPKACEAFFRSFRTMFRWEHYTFFVRLVLAFAFASGRRTVTNLHRHLGALRCPHRSRFNNFFHLERWNPAHVLEQMAYYLLRRLGIAARETIEFILDDSKMEKRGKRMEAVGWLHDSNRGRSIWGHQYITAVLRFRGVVIPFGICLYAKKEWCERGGRRFRKVTEIAAELIRSFTPPPGVRVRVLADCYYLCPRVLKVCREKDFRWVSVLKSNRNLFKGGRKLKAGSYGRNLMRRRPKKEVVIHKRKRSVRYTFVDAGTISVGRVGPARVVFSRRASERSILAIATDDRSLSGRQIIQAYDARWSIEVFFKDAKQLLGMGQYQNGAYGAAVIHLHLVCMAYSLLTHLALQCVGAQGARWLPALGGSTGRLQDILRGLVWQEMVKDLKKCGSAKAVIRRLDRLLVAA